MIFAILAYFATTQDREIMYTVCINLERVCKRLSFRISAVLTVVSYQGQRLHCVFVSTSLSTGSLFHSNPKFRNLLLVTHLPDTSGKRYSLLFSHSFNELILN